MEEEIVNKTNWTEANIRAAEQAGNLPRSKLR